MILTVDETEWTDIGIKPAIYQARRDLQVESTKSKIGQQKAVSELCHFI